MNTPRNSSFQLSRGVKVTIFPLFTVHAVPDLKYLSFNIFVVIINVDLLNNISKKIRITK